VHVPAAVRQPARPCSGRPARDISWSHAVGSNPKDGIGEDESWAAGTDRGCWPVRSFPTDASPSDGPPQVAGDIGRRVGDGGPW
jgi:hypothetical protein